MRNDKQTSSKKRVGESSKKECARFVINTNGTVLDNKTNLTWQREVPDEEFNWKQAKEYASQLNLGGYTDWRVPTRDELIGIVDLTRHSPAINPDCFPNTPSEAFWSSSQYAYGSDDAWNVNFSNGSSDGSYINNSVRVRCVR